MPNKHAAIKDLRKNERRALRNARLKTHVKALTKQFKDLVKVGKKSEAMAMSSKLQQATDKAAKNHVLHFNKARRMNSAASKMVSTK
jgi:ribosomal protein S20